MPTFIEIFVVCLVAVLLGGVPSGKLVAIAVRDKILTRGTGSPGPFLWYKKGQKGSALLSFALESGKIIAAMQAAWLLSSSEAFVLFAGMVAILAHGHSPFLHFTPCRSSAVYTGFCFGVNIFAGLLVGALWLGGYGIKKSQSLATFVQLLSLPPVLFFLEGTTAGFFGTLICAYGLWHHRRQFINSREYR